MKLIIGTSTDGTDILLTDEHHVCMSHKLPCVAIGHDVGLSEVRGKLDLVQTDKGLYDAARLVIDWLEAGQRSQSERAFAFRFLKDGAEYL